MEPPRGHQKSRSKKDRTQRVVQDKEIFKGIVCELEYFIAKLNELVPIVQEQARTLADQDLGAIRTMRELKLVLDASSGTIAASTERAVSKMIREDRVLQSLCMFQNLLSQARWRYSCKPGGIEVR